jgi:hypothetical protein
MSFLIPLGVGFHYWPNNTIGLGATFLLNLTDLDTGGDDTNIMPSLMFGIRF